VKGAEVAFISCSPGGSKIGPNGGSRTAHTRRSPFVDIHCHIRTAACEPLVSKLLTFEKEPYFRFSTAETREINSRHFSEVAAKLSTPQERLKDMDRMAVDIQVLSPSPFQFYYWVDAQLGLQLARMQNDHIAEVVDSYPDRFAGLGTVPLQDVGSSVVELERITKELAFGGVEISSNVNGTDLDDPRFEKFLAQAEKLQALIFIHPLGFSHAQRLKEFYLNNVIGQPLESTLAISRLIFSGVLERYPRLKLCVAHGGGYLPYYSGRLDHAYKMRPECRRVPHRPSFYLRRLYYDTVVYTKETLADLIRFAGSDHILLGTDYPFDMGEADPVGHVDKVSSLPRHARDKICGGNAVRLLNIR
jgi:aminocarboxymuconate-semialdehyde decarboxylase